MIDRKSCNRCGRTFYRGKWDYPRKWARRRVCAANCKYRGLSPAELQVIRLLALGLTAKEVAALLHVTLRTIHTHTTNAYRKLNANCLVDACRALGWLVVPGVDSGMTAPENRNTDRRVPSVTGLGIGSRPDTGRGTMPASRL